jgi:hypothetical protein
VGDRSRGRYATPADSPRHDGTPYRGLHVRRWGLGFVHRSRTIIYVAPSCQTLNIMIRNFCIAAGALGRAARGAHGGAARGDRGAGGGGLGPHARRGSLLLAREHAGGRQGGERRLARRGGRHRHAHARGGGSGHLSALAASVGAGARSRRRVSAGRDVACPRRFEPSPSRPLPSPL